MRHLDGKITCDAEIGRLGHWHGCHRKAVVKVNAAAYNGTYELHFCKRHLTHANDRSGKHFTPAPFCEIRELTVVK